MNLYKATTSNKEFHFIKAQNRNSAICKLRYRLRASGVAANISDLKIIKFGIKRKEDLAPVPPITTNKVKDDSNRN